MGLSEMSDTIQQIQAAVMNGLSRPEIEALLGRKLDNEEIMAFNKVKAITKLKTKQEEKQVEDQKKDHELAKLKQIYHKPAVLAPIYKRYTQEQFMAEVEANYGIVTLLCAKLDCTAKQFYKAIDEWKLRDFLKDCKNQLVGLAEKAILECLTSENENVKLRAAETTLKSLGKEEWHEGPQTMIQQQINIADKEAAIKNIFGIE